MNVCSTGSCLIKCKTTRCRTIALFNERAVPYATARDWRIVKELPRITNLIGRFPDHVAVLHVQIANLG